MFARVITVLEATLSQPVRVHDDLSEESVLKIREIAVNTLVQVIGADRAMAGLEVLSTDEQGQDDYILCTREGRAQTHLCPMHVLRTRLPSGDLSHQHHHPLICVAFVSRPMLESCCENAGSYGFKIEICACICLWSRRGGALTL